MVSRLKFTNGKMEQVFRDMDEAGALPLTPSRVLVTKRAWCSLPVCGDESWHRQRQMPGEKDDLCFFSWLKQHRKLSKAHFEARKPS